MAPKPLATRIVVRLLTRSLLTSVESTIAPACELIAAAIYLPVTLYTVLLCLSERLQKHHQILLLLVAQPRSEYEIEELDRIVQRQKTSIVQVGGRVLDPSQRERLDLPVGNGHVIADQAWLEEPSGLQIVHRVVRVIRRRVTSRALSLSKEERLSSHLLGRRFLRIELAIHSQLRRRWKIEDVLHLGHEVHLTASLQGCSHLSWWPVTDPHRNRRRAARTP